MEKLPHLVIPNPSEVINFSAPPRRGPEEQLIPRNRQQHGEFLKKRLDLAWQASSQSQVATVGTRNGVYLEFRSDPSSQLLTKSLEDLTSKQVRLLNVRNRRNENKENVSYATVYIGHEKRNHFLGKIEEYLSQESPSGNPKNQPLLASIGDITSALLVESFWTDLEANIPESEKEWVEVWIRCDNEETHKSFVQLVQGLGIETSESYNQFPERFVIIVKADRADLEQISRESDLIAEYRLAKESGHFFMELPNDEQAGWIEELQSRITKREDSESFVCVLDTGITNKHPLLSAFISEDDCYSVDPSWQSYDFDGHGTLMAGTSLYGDLSPLLESSTDIHINHYLESVKILPNDGENAVELWGYITSQAISRVEIQSPNRNRTFVMAITATDTRDRGRPTSWSATIDQLSSDWNGQRLIILSAGNSVKSIGFLEAGIHYPDIQITESAHDPAQSWNALTVGAFTSLTDIKNPNLSDYQPVAGRNELSPFSTTSLTWEENKWPIKPELVLEGGNLAKQSEFVTQCDEMSLLSLSHEPTEQGYFYPFLMTSAAAAQLARMSAEIRNEYPLFWEETIRALLVHSAAWPDELKKQFIDKDKKTDIRALMSICGYGVPDLSKALHSARNSLTLISQAEFQPFIKEKDGVKTKDMHFYDLPWPREELQSIPTNVKVKMRVTLSYFIEPGPGEIGWKDRYRYASHALRFDLNNPLETKDDFVKRINKAARAHGEGKPPTESAAKHWTIGSDTRDRGSIHSDIWTGTSDELAASSFIAVIPRIGWWKERPHLGMSESKTRYSLIVSIETESTQVDIYTPVSIQLGVPITIPVAT